jgi:hypothetical protein
MLHPESDANSNHRSPESSPLAGGLIWLEDSGIAEKCRFRGFFRNGGTRSFHKTSTATVALAQNAEVAIVAEHSTEYFVTE